MAELQKLSHRHDAIAEWLVANPDRSQRECATAFGYTEAWLSQLIHSDMFQALYRDLCEERKVIGVHTISAKMNAAAGLALDRLVERLQTGMAASDRLVTDTANSLLDKLGYSKGDVHLHQHQHVEAHFTAADLERAREKARVINAAE